MEGLTEHGKLCRGEANSATLKGMRLCQARASLVALTAKNLPAMKETRVSWVKIPGEKGNGCHPCLETLPRDKVINSGT